jgi:glycosyltransferase involved in cell wall biosynthesis
MANPKVSIMLITYNHEKYIAQALESILAQETEFSYVINVIEDCSTDQTQAIARSFHERYPDKVHLYFNRKNIGRKRTQKNFYRGFKTLTGDYLAILEGDDYWTSPRKLQSQVEFLEAHPDYAACAHNVLRVYEDNRHEPEIFLPCGPKERHTIEDLINIQSFFHTSGLLYRNVFHGKPPRYLRHRLSCDISIAIAHAQFGDFHLMPEVMSVYRVHSGGMFSGMPPEVGWMFNIDGLRAYNRWLGYRYFETFSRSITNYCSYLLGQEKQSGGKISLGSYRRLKYRAIGFQYKLLYHLSNRGRAKTLLKRMGKGLTAFAFARR